ncbi:disulfide bond formation protein [Pseudidiomarina salinarum]|uniref:Disulfide bond formation protein n=1 Tax=Pseudidiomarina salinarum TaxID=435908 RepID=A0A094IUL6_9GAMM|nr:disulfide bond formation protein B [Pseudidiomarina salinarum]KFZ30827.1 disulfide bond formation protein [Pseudidiomarina salinarum]RUO71297.1 disulfide bond formation protein B [Pseudidiomarina salinarum]
MIARQTSTAWWLLLAAWLIAFLSSLAVLFVGEVMGQTPCVLCWFQRAFMFPLAVILAIACYRSDFAVWHYAVPLAGIGALIALWHTLLYVGVIPERIQPCSATGPSCAGADMTILGGLPLPLLALIAFSTIIVLLLIVRQNQRLPS